MQKEDLRSFGFHQTVVERLVFRDVKMLQ